VGTGGARVWEEKGRMGRREGGFEGLRGYQMDDRIISKPVLVRR